MSHKCFGSSGYYILHQLTNVYMLDAWKLCHNENSWLIECGECDSIMKIFRHKCILGKQLKLRSATFLPWPSNGDSGRNEMLWMYSESVEVSNDSNIWWTSFQGFSRIQCIGYGITDSWKIIKVDKIIATKIGNWLTQ